MRRKQTGKRKTAKKGRDSKGRFLKGFYQPCSKGARINKAKKSRK